MAKNKSKEERKDAIIEAAVSEFLEKGFEGASINSIAKKAGLSKGGFYHHFKNKDEILISVNFRYLESVGKMIEKAKSNSNSADAVKIFIHEYLFYWCEHVNELQLVHLSLYKMIFQKETWNEITNYARKITSFLESLFIKGIISGKFIKHDPKSRAAALFSSLQGVTVYIVMNEYFTAGKAEEYFNSIFVDEITKS